MYVQQVEAGNQKKEDFLSSFDRTVVARIETDLYCHQTQMFACTKV